MIHNRPAVRERWSAKAVIFSAGVLAIALVVIVSGLLGSPNL